MSAPSGVVDKGALLYIIGCVFASTAICLVVDHLLIYRREDYQRLHAYFLRASMRLEHKKREGTAVEAKEKKDDRKKDKDKDKDKKKLAMLEREFEASRRDMLAFRRVPMLLSTFVNMAIFFSLKSSHEETIVARLPFTPFALLTGLTHRNLPGTDLRDCGVILIFALCSMAIKPNAQRLFGQMPPKAVQPSVE